MLTLPEPLVPEPDPIPNRVRSSPQPRSRCCLFIPEPNPAPARDSDVPEEASITLICGSTVVSRRLP